MSTLFLALLIGLVLDRIFGEVNRFHPLVGLGNCVQWLEKRLNQSRQTFTMRKMAGILALLLMLLPVIWLACLLSCWFSSSNFLTLLFSAVVLYFVVGWRSLAEHALAVHSALMKKDLSLARERVGYIVSRQTSGLDEVAVTKATMESVLENGSDAVFAPIFWFVVAGPVGAIAYRVINTLDAMWGYKNERFLAFGWAAAKLDDLVNWIPARLCALTYAFVSGESGWQRGLSAWKKQAPQCESPNAGPVMASGAGALNVALGGDAVYHGKRVFRPVLGQGYAPVPGDIERALTLVKRGVYFWVVVTLLATLFGLFIL
ncbi:MAG: adenosylcobinamide-phosphate synthase CbiB [Pseudomonadales bacterium]